MEFVYVLICEEWEDMVIILSKEDAIETSKKYPLARVEVFIQSPNGYVPTYNYYKNGLYNSLVH